MITKKRLIQLKGIQAMQRHTRQEWDNAEWYTWECPQCQTEHDDPDFIFESSCDCGAMVALVHGTAEGHADATLQE